jgi:glycosyltransferase involved in cell wall biosynthesis
VIDPLVRFVVYRYSHHSPHSGYSKLAQHYSAEYQAETILVSKPLSRNLVRERILWKVAKGTPGYDRASMAAEIKVASSILSKKGVLYHFLYGETTYHYTGVLNHFRQNRIIATFHQPLSGLRQTVQIDWHLRQLSGVICVGRSQQEFFKNCLDPSKIFFVPLGVDLEYYRPPSSFETRDPDLCVFVGENYRDFPTLRGVIELVSYKRPKTKFVGVLPARSHHLLGKHQNLSLYSGLSEEQLVDLYHTASLMVMPLHEATANNAILESMACGLPLVITDVGDVRDYVNPTCSLLVPPEDSRNMVEAVLSLLDAPNERFRMAEQSREWVRNYSWPSVVEQLKTLYSTIE